MKKIFLTKGEIALVDDEDFEWLNQWKWLSMNGYAVRVIYPNGKKGGGKNIQMHRLILGLGSWSKNGDEVDHKNLKKFDNRKENLRIVSHGLNQRNRKTYACSGLKGVYWDKRLGWWQVIVTDMSGKKINLGCFDDKIEAAKVRDSWICKNDAIFNRVNVM